MPTARQGAGGVHHVAFRTPDVETLHAWTERLASCGCPTSGEVERYYFRSLYFREPNGILFEIATDGPGFTVDEPLEASASACPCRPSSSPARHHRGRAGADRLAPTAGPHKVNAVTHVFGLTCNVRWRRAM